MTVPDPSAPLDPRGQAAFTPPQQGPAGGVLPSSLIPHPSSLRQGRPDQASPEAGARPGRRLEMVLGALVLLFAFLTASFAVRNADFWFHLATGRLLAEGRYQFGVDPFSYTTAQTYWANHAWLYDLLLYRLDGLVGGAGLVVLKALVIAVLAGLMLRVRRPGPSGWVSAGCIALALLVMSPRLLLQPTCLSCLFVGLTILLLWRAQAEARKTGWRYLVLPLLFALWVNLDDWFWLGPLLAALFWAGERLRGDTRIPAWVAPVGLAACLANPHGYHAFSLPAEVSPVLWRSGLLEDIRFRRLFASPWRFEVQTGAAEGVNLAGWAYFVLVGLGILSFVLDRRNLAGWRLPVWLVFGLLGAWQARLVPFFAVVAGPITALNLQDALAARPLWAGEDSRLHGLARWALVPAGLALVGLAWLGCLQGWRVAARRVAWGVQPNPSLRRVAETLRQWRKDEILKDSDRVFAFHPDVVHYCAWFCPEVKGFFDHRLPLFPEVAREYAEACRELNPVVGPAGAHVSRGWREVFRERGITHLVLYDPDPRILLAGVTRDWVLLRVDGEALICTRRKADAPAQGPGNKPEAPAKDSVGPFNPEHLAFGPVGKDEEAALPAAPGKGPGRGPRRPAWWEHTGRPEPLPAWESAAANVFLRLYEEAAPVQRDESLRKSWGGYETGLVGLAAQPVGPLAASGTICYYPLFLPGIGERPPALPLLAVRAARRALAENPDDANAYLRLAQAYLALRDQTAEHSRERRLPPLAMLRHIQIVTALEHSLVLRPDLEAAHQTLAELYGQRNYLDAALEHLRAQLALVRRGKPLPGEPPDQFAHRLALMEDRVLELGNLVGERDNQYASRAALLHDNPFGRAKLAFDLGLARKALDDVLLKSRVLLFGGDGARLELELMLGMGRAEEVRDLLDDEEMQRERRRLGECEVPGMDPFGRPIVEILPAYEWLLFCQSAAVGDYDRAAGVLQQNLLDRMQGWVRDDQPRRRHILSRALATELGAQGLPGGLLARWVRWEREQEAGALVRTYQVQAEAADLHVLAAMLELERGLPAAARRHLKESQELCPPGSAAEPYSAGRALDAACRHWLGTSPHPTVSPTRQRGNR